MLFLLDINGPFNDYEDIQILLFLSNLRPILRLEDFIFIYFFSNLELTDCIYTNIFCNYFLDSSHPIELITVD